jgi:hypothetical protein
MIMQSEKLSLNSFDYKRILSNALTFSLPVILIYLGSVSQMVGDGVSLSDFAINATTQTAIAVYILNTITDIIRKFVSGGTVHTKPLDVDGPVQ